MHVDTFKLSNSGAYVPFVRDENGKLTQVAFAPMDGAQEAFMCAPEREVGLAGNRGGGKTQIMLADYLSGVGRGWGAQYKGVLIRRSQREFTDLINLSESMIRPIWPKAAYNKLKNFWEFPCGEVLEFSYFDTPDQFGLYQGKSFVHIMFEELTLWPTLECYLLMFSCLRSPIPNIPRKVRFTCNPSGPGHNAVRHRFNLSGVPTGIAGPVITEIGKDDVPATRRMIFASFEDNVLLKRSDPEYMRAVEVACESDPAKLRAWKYGDWSVISGGAFDGIFFEHAKTIYVEPFELPATGRFFMSYDHGSTKPYACLFWWESDGSDNLPQIVAKIDKQFIGDMKVTPAARVSDRPEIFYSAELEPVINGGAAHGRRRCDGEQASIFLSFRDNTSRIGVGSREVVINFTTANKARDEFSA